MNITIVGGAGYTGGELIRILLHHPQFKIVSVSSRSQAGKPVHAVHGDLLGETEIRFDKQPNLEVDLVFLCMAHGDAKGFLEQNPISEKVKVVDLSSDFRKKGDHRFVYGLPELNRENIRHAHRIANPGCFATAIQLALLPLASEKLLINPVHIHAITGSTGAGQSLSPTSHFSWRENNLSIYKPFEHQHLAEIGQSLQQLQPSFDTDLNFLPLRGPFTRGIFASLYTNISLNLKEAKSLYDEYYQDHPFVYLSEGNPNLKQVVQSNKAILYLQIHEGKLLIISMIDNLIKGAAGQAVQNANLMFDLPEATGLKLKSGAY